jgi:hypothetical protein
MVYIFDSIIGNTIRFFYFKETSGLHFRTTYSIDSTTADLLIFGSSRANHHYVPNIFEDSIKMSYYNTGRDGNSIIYSYAVFKAIIKRYHPKIVILDIMPEDFIFDKSNYDRLSSLLPYYKGHPEIRKIIQLKSPYERLKLVSSIYPFNSELLTIAIGNVKSNQQRKPDIKGFIPLENVMVEDSLLVENNPISEIDTNKLNALNSIITFCRSNKIQIYIINSPKFAIVMNSSAHDKIKQITNENKIPFWDFSNNLLFLKHPEYFQDKLHLNKIGAMEFSKLVVSIIKPNNRELN